MTAFCSSGGFTGVGGQGGETEKFRPNERGFLRKSPEIEEDLSETIAVREGAAEG